MCLHVETDDLEFDWSAAWEACSRGVRRALAGYGLPYEEVGDDLTQEAMVEVEKSRLVTRIDSAKGDGLGLMYVVGLRKARKYAKRQLSNPVERQADRILEFIPSPGARTDLFEPSERAALIHAMEFLSPSERFAVEVKLEQRTPDDPDAPWHGTLRSAMSRGIQHLAAWTPRIARLLEHHPDPFNAVIHAAGRGTARRFTLAL